jgi:hypothetical protein
MGLVVRTSIYSAIAVVYFMAFTVVALQMHLDRWMPFALAAFLTAATLLTFRVFIAPRFDFDATEESLST